jgi:hypothetical protein
VTERDLVILGALLLAIAIVLSLVDLGLMWLQVIEESHAETKDKGCPLSSSDQESL